MLAAAIYDFVAIITLPGSMYSAWCTLSSPFRNFVKLEDLEDHGESQNLPVYWKIQALVVCALIESLEWLTSFAFGVATGGDVRVSNSQAFVSFLTWGYASFRVSKKLPTTPPYLLILFYIVSSVIACLALLSDIQSSYLQFRFLFLDFFRFFVPVLLASIAGSLPLQRVFPAKNVATPDKAPSNALSSPEDAVNLWSWCTFSFAEPMLSLAASRTLNESDVWGLSPYFKHKTLFKKYQSHRLKNPAHSLLRVLLASNSLDLILDIMFEFYGTINGFLPPYALQQILSAISGSTPEGKKRAYTWAFITFLAHLSFAQAALFQIWHTRRCYERTRGQLFCALHDNALKRRDLGNEAYAEDVHGSFDLGKVVNHMQGDVHAVAQRFWEFSKVFASPVRLIIALALLYRMLGRSSLAGFAVVVAAYILNYPLAKYNIYITRVFWRTKDRRMSLVNELFQNIRFFKFYGWDNRWAQRIRESRETELQWRVKENVVATLISFIWNWIPSMMAFTSFLWYTLIAGEQLTVSTAFTSLALFNQIQEPMAVLPAQIFALLHSYVSLGRIEEFLTGTQVPDWASTLKSPIDTDVIGFTEASFEWPTSPNSSVSLPDRFELGPLNVRFPKGKLTLVSGSTGSGKSALLAALLGELHCTSGTVHISKANHQVAYCAQNPWLRQASIRDNIVFNSPRGYDEVRYNAVLIACALTRDLANMDAGDLTEIGEKGVTLSGGQKARVALARALYSQATCVLLDDPLAAVDAHTARELVLGCFSGEFARGRTIILATHQIDLCRPFASYIVELHQGKILQQGPTEVFQNLESPPNSNVETLIPEDRPASESGEVLESDGLGTFQSAPMRTPKWISTEARAEGRISLQAYMAYIRAAGWLSCALMVVFLSLIRLTTSGNQLFLAKWGDAYNRSAEVTSGATRLVYGGLPPPDVDVRPWLVVFLCISVAGACALAAYIAWGYYVSLQASRSLFLSMLASLVGAPVRFFDTTPIGRILNRFTADIGTIDGVLRVSAQGALSSAVDFAAALLLILWVIPTFAPVALGIVWLYVRLARRYLRASRDLRRLESVSLSPVFTGFDELLAGLAHVRAFGVEAQYREEFYSRIDAFQSFGHVYWLVNGWLRWRYDCLGSLVYLATTCFAIWSDISSGYAGLVILHIALFTGAFRQLVNVATQLEIDFNSVERVVEYVGVPQEAALAVPGRTVPAYWPSSSGGLAVEGLVVRYAPDLPAVLRGLSFTARPAEKIAVVGRTGAGKSTLASSFLRMVEASEGRIIIDDVDIATVSLGDLRTRIVSPWAGRDACRRLTDTQTFVSQDAALFSGTVRTNLDPFGEHSDLECWDALERCHLLPLLCAAGAQPGAVLNMPVNQGRTLSAGERQLLALGRAVLRRTGVVVMDEATSQVDARLDDQIRDTIGNELGGCLVITIAHRLRTVVGHDRVLVMRDGEVVEYDAPRTLLERRGGVFREMCRGSVDWHFLEAAVGGGEM